MSLEDRVREAEAEAREASTAQRAIPWVVLGLAALLLLELFAHPLLAASVLCLKFAFNDFLTAIWLFRTDPRRGRAWATSLLYFAVGFWKAAVINYALFTAAIVYTLVSGQPAWPQRPANAPAPGFLDDPLTPWAAPTVAGHAIEFFLGAAALVVAYVNHQKLWLGPGVSAARRRGTWPPADATGGNWLRWTTAGVLAGVPVTLWVIGFVAISLVPPPPAVNLKEWETVEGLSVGFAIMLTLPVLLVAGCTQDKQNRYLLAHTPAECWEEAGEPGTQPGD